MNIARLDVEGFRSLREVTWTPGRLNVMIGPNAAGKSNLLKALECLVASAQGRLGRYVQREGGMGAVAWEGTASELKFHLITTEEPTPGRPAAEGYLLRLVRLGASSGYTIDEERLYLRHGEDPPSSCVNHFLRTRASAVEFGGSPRKRHKLREPMQEDESLLSAYVGPFATRTEPVSFRSWLASWTIYSDFLTHPEAPVRRPAVARQETRLDRSGENLVTVLHTLYGGRDFKRELDLAMRAGFGDDYEELVFAPDADQRVQLRIRWRGSKRDQGASELSDGTLRFLFLVAALANPDPPPFIAIDEPELGLHPSMLPVVAELAWTASHRTQVLLTTHSAELLDGFREYEPPPVVTVVGREEGATRLRRIEGETLAEWLRAYTLGGLFRSGELEALS